MPATCFGVGTLQIAAAVRPGNTSVRAVGRSLRAGTNCSSCRAEIRAIIESESLPEVQASCG
ncbi:(2Fe-2S)-binding protein [Chelativorans petroleitrophicus]|uniref:(2Fe-2S)-binding protein n=1 Tax=Chelativorans petroleitrophicus TaxID=2975484 RepID=UPI003C2F4842